MSILVISLAQAAAPEITSRVRGRERVQSAAQDFDGKTAQRLYRITSPLLRAMEHTLGPQQVSIGIVADDAINAANGSGGKFFVTTGLLERANDDQLRGVMAHVIAHEDVGHVAKLKLSATGMKMVLLKELETATTALSLIEGPLVTLNFSRPEENQADHQSLEILRRAGYSKEVVIESLNWMAKSKTGTGNFVSSHPNIGERIKNLQAMAR